MKSIQSIKDFRKFRKKMTGTVGFIPTMGALHAGHKALIKKSLKKNDFTVASIFVNPTQFNNQEDFEKYPATLKSDLKILKKLKVTAVFLPTKKAVYPDDFRFFVNEEQESKLLCGNFRPGHFKGVLTVVLKLLNIVRPTRAYFGEKDFQQLKLIQDMCDAFFLDCKIVPVPIVRENSGLALSSRNQRLTPKGRKQAQLLSEYLGDKTASPALIKKKLTQAGFKVEYVEDLWKRRFVAAQVEDVRLIDNVSL